MGGDRQDAVLDRMVRQLAAAANDPAGLVSSIAVMTSAAMDAACELVELIGEDLVPVAYSLPRHDSDDARVMLAGDPLSIASSTNTARAARERTTIHVAHVTDEALRVRYENDPTRLARVRKLEYASALFVPIRARSKVLGVLSIYRQGEGAKAFDVADIEFAERAAELAALAVTNARLQRRAARYELLAKLAREFSRPTTSYEAQLDLVARLVGEAMGDSCGLRMLREDGTYATHASIYNRDPELAARHLALFAPVREPSGLAARVLEVGSSLLLQQIDTKVLASLSPEVRDQMKLLAMDSVVIVPVKVYGSAVAILLVSRTSAMPMFTSEDVDLLDDVAAHAGCTITNARLIDQLRAGAGQERLRIDLAVTR
ncbi:MAG: GAF domain-containing protein [Kofleriaceae bacterium]